MDSLTQNEECTSGNQSFSKHVKCPDSVVEEIPDEPPCCVTHLAYALS